jgi:uncharacterized protein YndB with AHSA1/START domain
MKMYVASPVDEAIIIMSRTFDAPREVVWTAFTDPRHVAKWYGGHGFSNPVCEIDVRPGGLWRHTMRTPDGGEFKMEFVYVEVVRPERLVWKNSDHGKPQPPGRLSVINTVTLEDAGRQTRWRLIARFESIAERDLAVKKGFTSVITQGSEKLNDVVRALSAVAEAS